MKFNTPPEARIPPRASHVGHGEGVALVHEAFGSKLQGGQQVNSLDPNYDSAIRWSTAPYTGPNAEEAEAERYVSPHGYRSSKRQGFCFGNDDTCKARATARWDPYCNAHGRMSAGLSAFDTSLDQMPDEKPEE